MIPTQYTVDTPYMVGPVHCYTAELEGELVLFDTGPATDVGRRFLKNHIDLNRLKHVIVTHCHIDHYGQTSWLEQNSQAAIYLPYRDIIKIKRHEERLEKMYELLSTLGFGDEYLDTLREAFHRGVLFPPFPENYLIADRDIPAAFGLEATSCAGHSQTDLVYSTDRWAITGDTLLKGIYQSPLLDIDLVNGGRFKNYQAYCNTIVKLARLVGKHILPGHRQSIDSVEATIRFYIVKTLYRAEQLKSSINNYSVAEVIDRVFGKKMIDPFHVYVKTSEIVFMKDLLENPELIRSSLETIGWFEQVKEDYERIAG